MNQNKTSSTGTPITAETATPLSMSMTYSLGVILLNPNLASTTKVEYREKGKRITPKRNETDAMKRMPWT